MQTVPSSWAFQSTLSVRRATFQRVSAYQTMIFQSTLSVRRATGTVETIIFDDEISIHALREESDTTTVSLAVQTPTNFNPRSP